MKEAETEESPSGAVDVLLVDDNPDNLLSLEAILEDPGVNVLRASSGNQALEAAFRAPPAVILLDVQMPGMNGFEVARHLRSLERTRGVPIIFVTATHREEKFTFEGFESGAVDYLFKPLNPTIVRSKVKVFVELHRKSLRLEQTVRELLLINRELESFTYSVSHDLKAPVRSVIGFSKALLEEGSANLTEAQSRYLRLMHSSGERMSHLIDSLLELSKVTQQPLQKHRVSLSALARKVCDELQAEEGRRAEFRVSEGLEVFGDAKLLEIAVRNLLGNAYKFTGKRPDPQIEFGVTKSSDSLVYFVRDNGAGFDMTRANRLFGAFQRLHDEADFSGTGVGLATVKRIIHRHNGEIWAEAEPGKGATFYFTM
jgi:signal transduction histidine kinase